MANIKEGFQAIELQKAYKLPVLRQALFHNYLLLIPPGEFRHIIYWTRQSAGLGFIACPCMKSIEFGGPCKPDHDCITSLTDFVERRRAYRASIMEEY